jgi:hypothetical protein
MKSAMKPSQSVVALQADPHSERLDLPGLSLAPPFSGHSLAQKVFPAPLLPHPVIPLSLWRMVWWLASPAPNPSTSIAGTGIPMLSPVGFS